MPNSALPHHHEDDCIAQRLQSFVNEVEHFSVVANIFKLMSDTSRIRVFWLLCHCEECVQNLSSLVNMSPPAVSHHLKQLKSSGLIVSRRNGKEVYYRAADTAQTQLLHLMIEQTMEISCPDVSDTP